MFEETIFVSAATTGYCIQENVEERCLVLIEHVLDQGALTVQVRTVESDRAEKVDLVNALIHRGPYIAATV